MGAATGLRVLRRHWPGQGGGHRDLRWHDLRGTGSDRKAQDGESTDQNHDQRDDAWESRAFVKKLEHGSIAFSLVVLAWRCKPGSTDPLPDVFGRGARAPCPGSGWLLGGGHQPPASPCPPGRSLPCLRPTTRSPGARPLSTTQFIADTVGRRQSAAARPCRGQRPRYTDLSPCNSCTAWFGTRMALGFSNAATMTRTNRFGRKNDSGFGTEMRTCSVPLLLNRIAHRRSRAVRERVVAAIGEPDVNGGAVSRRSPAAPLQFLLQLQQPVFADMNTTHIGSLEYSVVSASLRVDQRSPAHLRAAA